MLKKFLVAAVACLALSPAFAVLTFTLTETGGNVVSTASGSVNTAALTFFDGAACPPSGLILPSKGGLCSGVDPGFAYMGMTGPLSFGAGAQTTGISTAGDTVGVSGQSGGLVLPFDYTSGSPVSSTATFTGATLASLGVTPGIYTWTFGSGATADSVVVIAAGAASNVPTLGEWALVLLAALMGWVSLCALRRRTA